jgi:uncharacterized repeat protein (TIGR01451 family)
MNKKFYPIFIALLCCTTIFAQHDKKIIIAKNYIHQQLNDWHLTETDIADLSVDNVYQTKHNGLSHIYLRQRYQGIKIFNAITTVNVLPNGEVLHASNRFLPNIATKVNSQKALISPEAAILAAAQHLKMERQATLNNKSATNAQTFLFKKTNISNSDIKVELIYTPTKAGKLLLSWQLAVDMIDNADYWNIRVDAISGTVIEKNNWTTYCKLGMHNHSADCAFLEKQNKKSAFSNQQFFTNNGTDGASYNVFAVPLESPAHGNRSIVSEPADPQASPFGWHDIDGVAGPEFTITRGNNVHAYADTADINRTSNNEPDGGASLTFNPSYDPNNEPLANQDAAVTQLFYMNNIMHDLTYGYGFDEGAGNFQERNNTATGVARDYVEAEALDDFDNGTNGNATFSTPPDGSNPTMSAFVWNRGGGKLLHVSAPPAVAGSYEAVNATFGPNVEDTPVSGGVAVVLDGSSAPTLGCNPIQNTADIAGKIAIIDRGSCNFVDKIRNAQAAGAIAAIVCNFEPALVNMGAPPNDNTNDITIPSVFIRSGECAIIRQFVGEGLTVDLKVEASSLTGPDQLDGSFDNGIVAHEYAHGISTRLTGGPANSNCLNNIEQMGEGWSDFFSLITSVEPGDQGSDVRGVGTFVLRQENDGVGIRRFPYSTDMSVNPLTYRNVLGASIPHGLGEVWTVTLWDLYWAMSDKYGWDADLYHGTGGNNKAIQLVMDGMKIQACNPGFIDGRDAILAADRANNGGENQCLIWEVFARRGLGFSASQGDNDDNNDIIEGFDVAPECTNELTVAKTMTPSISAGDQIAVTINVSNFKNETLNNLTATDEIPEGATPIMSSLPSNATVQGNTIKFDLPQLASGATNTIKYSLSTSNTASVRQFLDDGEEGDAFWLPINLDDESTNIWDLQDVIANSGQFAWHVSNPTTDSEQALQLDEEIVVSGKKPVLRFSQQLDTDPGTDAGSVEISTDFGSTWQDLDSRFIRNGYTGPVSYFTFSTPDRQAFWGNSGGFTTSYVDLSEYIGETIIIRFRFGSVEDNAGDNGAYNGWFIDDVEFLDLHAYQSQVCVSSSQGDNACAMAAEGGTFVEPGTTTSLNDLEQLGLLFEVFPNPAGDYINVSLSNEESKEGTLSLLNMNGQELLNQAIHIDKNTQILPLNVKSIAAGFYFIKIQTDEGIAMKKIVLE